MLATKLTTVLNIALGSDKVKLAKLRCVPDIGTQWQSGGKIGLDLGKCVGAFFFVFFEKNLCSLSL